MAEPMDAIALRHGTDKASDHHNYTARYEHYFSPLRDQTLKILELGWGGPPDSGRGGSSAMLWRDYFPNSTVVCVDIVDKEIRPEHDGIIFARGDQSDKQFLDALSVEHGPWDIIIDDASHLSTLTIRSWEILYPHLKAGGLYVVEDTHMSYHDWYYPKTDSNQNPDERAQGNRTCMQYFQRMADEVNYRDHKNLFPKQYSMGYALDWVHFYFNILFVRKR